MNGEKNHDPLSGTAQQSRRAPAAGGTQHTAKTVELCPSERGPHRDGNEMNTMPDATIPRRIVSPRLGDVETT
jgi:hypothetical protein